MPDRWGWRMALGLVAGLLLVVGLERWVTGEQRTGRDEPPSVGPVAGVGRRSPEVLRLLRGNGTWLVYLTDRRESLPTAAAPVVAILPGGRLRLLRPAPRIEAPGERWLAAGVVLPGGHLSGLDPAMRVALLDVLSQLAAGSALTPDQVVPLGVEASPGALRRLLRWQR